ncbi:MAG TPA: MFS transporter [bacterium]|jgi:MFS family permease|nr:MFS transporter [bacterium]HNZ51109.1 MFS transporter [bacterium]HOH85343.1 MFS transporter [bacterium]HPW44396.1 MFS transporter [bacterium]HPX64272.1 MFS transporter [bacterium]
MQKTKSTFYLIYGLVFITALIDAMVGYVQSSFLNQFLPLEYIGLFWSLVTIITIAISFIYPRLARRYSTYRLMIITYFLAVAANFIISSETTTWLILVSFIVRYLSIVFIFVNMDVLLENISDDGCTGVIRTKYLTAMNAAWLISPLIMGYLVGADNNYQRIYYIGGLLMLPALFLIITRRRQFIDAKNRYRQQDAAITINQLLGHRDRRGIFLSSLTLQFFYSLMSLYIPIYLHQHLGLSWSTLSIIFTFMLLPFVIIQMPAGLLADRFFGEKEMLTIGNLIMIIAVVGIIFTKTANPFVWGFLLFFSRVGAALAESMHETYFFKKVGSRDMAVINLYRQNKPIGWLIASLAAFITLSFLPLKSIFIVLFAGLVIGLIPIIYIRDTR